MEKLSDEKLKYIKNIAWDGGQEEMHDLVSMSAELLELREQTRWKTINKAPKDGTHILTIGKEKTIKEAWWKKDILENWSWGGNGWSYADPPTYFMLIPPAPESEE